MQKKDPRIGGDFRWFSLDSREGSQILRIFEPCSSQYREYAGVSFYYNLVTNAPTTMSIIVLSK